MINVLITGHTGFIGSNMLNFLKNKKNVKVIGYSKSTGQDIFNLKQLENFVKKADLVYHFAAYAKPGESIIHPKKTIETNIKSCLNILEVCKKYKKPLIYPSSCEIYGNSRIPIDENFPPKPPNPYAASKLASEGICYSYYLSYNMDIKIVRLFNPYGPNQQLNKIIPTFYFQAIKNKNITVFGNGKDTRDYVYINDIVRGLWLARKLEPGEIINLATGKATTNLQIARIILKLTKSNSKISFVKYPKKFGNIKYQIGSYKKAKKLIGWYPKINLEKGIELTIKWLEKIKGKVKNER